jgi:hypothetical protein
MRACVDTVTIGQPQDNGAGTSIVLRSRAVPSLLRALGAEDDDTDPPHAATAI